MELNKKELKTVYDTAKSFYKKAYYDIDSIEQTEQGEQYACIVYRLFSYNTLICKVWRNSCNYMTTSSDYVIKCNKDDLTMTTTRHLREFLKQFLSPKTEVYKNLQKDNFSKKAILKYACNNKGVA